jgi:hypothetical protein
MIFALIEKSDEDKIMVSENNRETVREVAGIFFDGAHLKAAVLDLESAGFDHEQISLLASEFAVEKSLGDLYTRPTEHPDPDRAPATAFVLKNAMGDTFRSLGGGLFFAGSTAALGALVASTAIFGGALLPAVTGAVAVGTVGALTASMIIHRNDAEYLEEQIEEGHLLLFVRASDHASETQAVKILTDHSGFDVKIYEVPLNPPSQKIHR